MAREIQFLASFRYANVFNDALRLVAAKRIDLRPLISEVFPLRDAGVAMVRAGAKENVLKVQINLT